MTAAEKVAAALDMKKHEVYAADILYRELGYYIIRREQFERALQFFDEALRRSPSDKRALMGRSLARAKAVQYEGALEDINKALDIALARDPDDLVMMSLKALNTYLNCEFEHALVQNLRGLPKRKKPDNFSMGVMHCNQAIENGLGDRAGRPLRDHYKIIRKLAWQKAREAENLMENRVQKRDKKKNLKKKVEEESAFEPLTSTKIKKASKLHHVGHYPCGEEPEGVELEIKESLYSHMAEDEHIPAGKPYPYRPLQRYTTNIENYMAEKYLKGMYLDKKFLKTLNDNPGVKSPNKQGFKQIIQLARNGYKTLSYKQELLRTRRPFYFIKYQETSLSEALIEKRQRETKRIQAATEKQARVLLSKVKNHMSRRNTRLALEEAENLKAFCDASSKKYLPRRDVYLEEIYNLIGQAYLDLKRINHFQSERDQNKRIYQMLGMHISGESSTDSILKEFKGVFIDWRKQISIAEDRIRNAKSRLELAWLYHDLARYYTEIKQIELGRVYARKCIVEARECKNLAWIVNAKMLITRINIQQHNRTDAKIEVNASMELAKEMNNEVLQEYLERTLAVVEAADFEDVLGTKVVEKRQNQIISMMAQSNMKEEMSHMFRQMANLPASRRMSVMPGIRFTEEKPKSGKKSRKTSRIQLKKDNEKDAKTSKPSKKKNVIPGIEFMKMIQFHVDDK